MGWYPEAKRIPVSTFGYPQGARGGNRPIAVVHHIAEGYWGTLTNPGFWESPYKRGSVHFAVSFSGEVAQFVDTDDAAWGNGIVKNPTWPPALSGNPNEKTVSIEHEGFTGVPWPEAQYQASKRLTRWILATHGLDAGADTIIGHYRIDGVNRLLCPGKAWPLERMLTDLNTEHEEDELLAEYKDVLDWIKSNKGALSPYVLAARTAGFDGEHDTKAKDDDVSRGIRRLADFMDDVLMAPLATDPKDTADRLARALSRD